MATQAIIPDVLWATAEFQGGAFDPWGGVSTRQIIIINDWCIDEKN